MPHKFIRHQQSTGSTIAASLTLMLGVITCLIKCCCHLFFMEAGRVEPGSPGDWLNGPERCILVPIPAALEKGSAMLRLILVPPWSHCSHRQASNTCITCVHAYHLHVLQLGLMSNHLYTDLPFMLITQTHSPSLLHPFLVFGSWLPHLEFHTQLGSGYNGGRHVPVNRPPAAHILEPWSSSGLRGDA